MEILWIKRGLLWKPDCYYWNDILTDLVNITQIWIRGLPGDILAEDNSLWSKHINYIFAQWVDDIQSIGFSWLTEHLKILSLYNHIRHKLVNLMFGDEITWLLMWEMLTANIDNEKEKNKFESEARESIQEVINEVSNSIGSYNFRLPVIRWLIWSNKKEALNTYLQVIERTDDDLHLSPIVINQMSISPCHDQDREAQYVLEYIDKIIDGEEMKWSSNSSVFLNIHGSFQNRSLNEVIHLIDLLNKYIESWAISYDDIINKWGKAKSINSKSLITQILWIYIFDLSKASMWNSDLDSSLKLTDDIEAMYTPGLKHVQMLAKEIHAKHGNPNL